MVGSVLKTFELFCHFPISVYISVLSFSTLLCDSNAICDFEIGQLLSKIQLPKVDALSAEISLRKKFVSILDPTCTVTRFPLNV